VVCGSRGTVYGVNATSVVLKRGSMTKKEFLVSRLASCNDESVGCGTVLDYDLDRLLQLEHVTRISNYLQYRW